MDLVTETVKGITLGELWTAVVALAVAFAAIVKVFDWFSARKKKLPCDERLHMLENDNARLKAIEKKLEEQEQANSIILQTLLAVLQYERDNSNSNVLTKAEEKIQKYLIER